MARSQSIRLQEKSPLHRQSGFALTETLVATAIIAGVIAAVATGISGALRLSKASEARQAVLLEAENIAARLEAGLPEDDVLEGYDHWEVSYRPLEIINSERSNVALPVEVSLSTTTPAEFLFSTIVLLTAADLEARQ